MAERQVQILIGSDSDAPTMQRTVDLLRELGISCHMTVASAHRSPDRVRQIVEDAPAPGGQGLHRGGWRSGAPRRGGGSAFGAARDRRAY